MDQVIEVDVVILSYAQNDELKNTTLAAIDSLRKSEDSCYINFNIVIVESQQSLWPYQYPGTITLYPDTAFGYHRFMNIGIEVGSSPYVCLCNNDVIFYRNWASEILKPLIKFRNIVSASPFCPVHHPSFGFKINDGFKPGYRIRLEVAGWCIIMKRELFAATGKLDENYVFWYSDNDYSNTLWCLNLWHVLVTSSLVEHLESKTLKQQSADREQELTEKAGVYFQKKWKFRLGNGWTPFD